MLRFRDETLESLKQDDIKLAAVERLLERIVMRAIDVNEHLLSELGTGEGRSTRLTDRDTFPLHAPLGVYPRAFAAEIARSQVCATSTSTTIMTPTVKDRTRIHRVMPLRLPSAPLVRTGFSRPPCRWVGRRRRGLQDSPK